MGLGRRLGAVAAMALLAPLLLSASATFVVHPIPLYEPRAPLADHGASIERTFGPSAGDPTSPPGGVAVGGSSRPSVTGGIDARGEPSVAPIHSAPSWPGWDPASGRPSPNLPRDFAVTVPLSTASCSTSYPPWAWLAYDPLDDSFWVAAPSSCVDVIAGGIGDYPNITASYAVGTDPFGVAVDTATGDVYVTNTGSDNVTVIDGATGVTVANISVGSSPYGVAYDPTSGDLYVANGGSNNLSVIAGANETVLTSVGVGTDPIGVAVDPATGQVFVANNGSANVTVLATSTNAVVANVAVGQEPYGVAIDNASDQVYVTNLGSDNVSVLDASNNSVAVTIDTGSGMSPEGVAYNPVHHLVWVGADFYTVLINTTTQSVLGYEATDPSGVAVDPTTGVVCVTNTGNASLRCISYPDPIFPGTSLVFTETGLASTTNWSVTLYWPGYYQSTASSATDYYANEIWFYVFSGGPSTYTYTVPPAGGYYPTVPTSSVVVSGASTTYVNVSFVNSSSTYPVTFNESGLATGAAWSVTLAGITNRSTSGQISFREPNGTYAFGVTPVSGFSASPSVGTLLVEGAGVDVSVAFTRNAPPPANATVTFVESGLPNGTQWEVSVDGVLGESTASWLAFSLSPGEYAYQIYPVPQFVPGSPSVGYFTLVSGNLTIAAVFLPVFSLEFQESGLPTPVNWSVTVDTLTEVAIAPDIGIALPEGPHTYVIGAVSGYTAQPAAGVVQLDSDATVAVVFTAQPPPVPPSHAPPHYGVTLTQSGLPDGTGWCATINGTELCTAGSTVATDLANGTAYSYVVSAVPGYFAEPSSGSFAVQGGSVELTVSFSAAAVASSAGGVASTTFYVVVGTVVALGLGAGMLAGLLVARRSRRW